MSLSLVILLYYMILTILYTVRRSLSTHTDNSQSVQLSEQQANAIDVHLQTKWCHLFYYILLFVSVLLFAILLTQKLEAESHETLASHFRSSMYYQNLYMNSRQEQKPSTPSSREPQILDSLSYLAVFSCLNGAYIALILLSFNSRHGNIWWFGLGRRDYCQMFLCLCPIFNVYGNISLEFSLTGRKVPSRSNANEGLIVVAASQEHSDSNSYPSFVINQQQSNGAINNLSLNIDLDQSSLGASSSNEIYQSAQSIGRVSTARKIKSSNSLQASDSEVVALRSMSDKNEANGASFVRTEIVILELPD